MKKSIAIACLLCWGLLNSRAIGSGVKLYEMVGTVVKITSESLLVRCEIRHETPEDSSCDQKLFEFGRGSMAELEIPKSIRVGDRITLWYTLDAHRLNLMPSQIRPEPRPGGTVEDSPTNPRIILDDRAFYEA